MPHKLFQYLPTPQDIDSFKEFCRYTNEQLGVHILDAEHILQDTPDNSKDAGVKYVRRYGFIIDKLSDLYLDIILEAQVDVDKDGLHNVTYTLTDDEYTGPGYQIPETEIIWYRIFDSDTSPIIMHHDNVSDIGKSIKERLKVGEHSDILNI